MYSDSIWIVRNTSLIFPSLKLSFLPCAIKNSKSSFPWRCTRVCWRTENFKYQTLPQLQLKEQGIADSSCWVAGQPERPDGWDSLPSELLEKIASGRNDLKAMRGVCTHWKAGYEVSVSKIHMACGSQPLPLGSRLGERYNMLHRYALICLRLDVEAAHQLCAVWWRSWQLWASWGDHSENRHRHKDISLQCNMLRLSRGTLSG